MLLLQSESTELLIKLCASYHRTLISQAEDAVQKLCVDNPQRANYRGAHTFQQGQAACRK